jgi:ribonuclease P protein component
VEGESLPAFQPLKDDRHFRRTFSKGRKFVSKNFIVFLEIGDGEPQVGVRTTKSFRNAVERNRVKRIIREICARYVSSLRGVRSMIVVGRRGALRNSLKTNKIELVELLKKTGCLDDMQRWK